MKNKPFFFDSLDLLEHEVIRKLSTQKKLFKKIVMIRVRDYKKL